MGRKYTEVQKRRWVELFEQGKSEAWIAGHPIDDVSENQSCDIRTVVSAIRRHRKQDQLLAAEAVLIQNSLRNHQDKLLQAVEGIILRLDIPPSDAPLTEEGYSATWKNDELSDVRLLREHLDSKTLAKLTKWEGCYTRHFAARRIYKEKLTGLIQEKTGLEFTDGNQKPPYLYQESVYAMFRFSLSSLLSSLNVKPLEQIVITPDLNREVRVDSQTGRVVLRNAIIVECPGQEKAYYKKVLEAVSELLKSEAAGDVSATARELVAVNSGLRIALKELILLGMVPGHCRICRRLGLR